jgi:N-succinyldiaminopimelate aminotransferase
VPASVWDRCQLLYLCNPGNPAGAVMDLALLQRVLTLAERHDFVVAADECYADIYPDESAPPPSLLSAALALGDAAFRRCLVFHSLSKRSSLPGLRSGFVAGDARLLERFLLYRTYHGCSMPLPVQQASIVAWSDDAHARDNRALYREKFARVLPILAPHLDVQAPAGGFYLWPHTGRDDETFVRELYARKNVTVVPGSYLARDAGGGNPGAGRVRISLVAGVDECVEAAHRIADLMQGR